MFIRIDFESAIPIYEQLKNEIIIGIARKELHPGERLPAVRQLASDIGINLHTVNKAYQQLQQEGFILIHRQRGAVINPDGPPTADKVFKKELYTTLRPLLAEAHCRGMKIEELEHILTEIFTDLEGETP